MNSHLTKSLLIRRHSESHLLPRKKISRCKKKSVDNKVTHDYNIRVLATIAQLAEHLIRNERVVGSNPISGSKTIRNSIVTAVGFFFYAIFSYVYSATGTNCPAQCCPIMSAHLFFSMSVCASSA